VTPFVILPVPYEATTTYGKGTKKGPVAILRALDQVEEFDEELGREICEPQILKPIRITCLPAGRRILASRITGLLKKGKIPITLGGEHSITAHAVKAFAEHYRNLSVLQLDAHADLRDKYKGSKNNHACVMRRVLEMCPAVQVGVRNISKEGYAFAQKSGQIKKINPTNLKSKLSKNVYITIDVDVFDPSVVPAVGTPEPGGMLWYEVLDVLKGVCATKNVVGFDVVELSPRKGDIVSDFTVAKLIYKTIAYLS